MTDVLIIGSGPQLAETNLWQSAEQYKLFASQFYGWTRDFKTLEGGRVVTVNEGEDVNALVRKLYPDAKRIASNLKNTCYP